MRLVTGIMVLLAAISGGIAFATPPAFPEMTAEEKKLDALVTQLCEKDDAGGLLLALQAAENMHGFHKGKIGTKAIRKLGQLKHAEAVAPLRRWAKKGNIEALTALAQIGGEEAVDGLIHAARFGQGKIVRRRAIALLGAADDPRVVAVLLGILSDTDEPQDLRLTALRSLTKRKIDQPRARKILALAANPDDPLASAVLREMGRQKDPAVLSPLIETLSAYLDRIDKPQVIATGNEEKTTKEKAAKEKAAELFEVGLSALEKVARAVSKGTEHSVILRSEVSVSKGKVERFRYKRAEVRGNQAERKRVLTLWEDWWKENKPSVLAPAPEADTAK